MTVECPHCFTRVLPGADGVCPACRKRTDDVRDVDPQRTALTVHAGQSLPDFCCDCGAPTMRVTKVKHRTKGESGAVSDWFAVLAFLSFGMLDANGRGGRRADTLVVQMPQCEACAARAAPQLVSINTEELRMTFAVHRDFQAQATAPPASSAGGR